MNIFLDVDSHQLIQSPGARSPASPITIKSQDTLAVNIFFVSEGVVLDMGESPVLKFGLIASADATILLVLETTFARQVDPITGVNVYYQAFAQFNTSEMVTALGTAISIPCICEIRYQLTDTEVVHTLDQSVTVYRTILLEAGTPDPTEIPSYPDVSTLELVVHKDQPSGYAALDSGGKLTPSVIPSTVELIATRDVASGHAGLDTDTLLAAAQIPVDGVTVVAVAGKITAVGPAQGVVAATTEAFTVPAVGATVPVSVRTDALTVGAYYILSGGAGLYQLNSVTDTTHGVFTNVGSALNAAPAAVIPFGVTLTWSGPPGPAGVAGADGATGATGAPGAPGADGTGGDMMKSIYDTVNRGYVDRAVLADTATALVAPIAQSNITNLVTDLAAKSPSLVDDETSAGLTLLGSTAGHVKRLIAGTNITLDPTTTAGGVIIAASGGGGGGGGVTPIHCQVTRTADWTWADGTAIPWTAVVDDSTGMWSSGANTRLTVATAGIYLVCFQGYITWGTQALNLLAICVNGLTKMVISNLIPMVSGQDTIMALSGTLKLAASDYVEICGSAMVSFPPAALKYKASGATNTPQSPYFSLDLIG